MGHDQIEASEDGLPPYFAVSLRKLVLMSIGTLGLYEVWWFYKNWSRIKHREQSDISPAWRAVFTPIWAYACFARIRTSAKSLNIPVVLPAGPLTLGWFITLNLWRLPDPYWLVCYLTPIWLIPVQISANRINSIVAPEHLKEDAVNRFEIAMVSVGALLLVLTIIGMASPN